jgi:nucleotide-binding universal stress UspA family protein
MTGPGEAVAPRRVLVALEAGESAPALLEAAANLAAGLHAELVGLFVEDSELLEAAELPVTRSVPSHAQALVPLDARLMRRAFRIWEAKAGDALASAAGRWRVKWSFQVVRGTMEEQILAEVRSHDLLALGTPGKAVRRARLAAASRALAERAPCSVLLMQAAGGAERPVAVIYDGSERALATGDRLARIYRRPLHVLAVGDSEAAAAALHEAAAAWLERHRGGARIDRHVVDSAAEICEALKRRHPGMLVLDPEGALAGRFGLEAVLGELKCSVLVLR